MFGSLFDDDRPAGVMTNVHTLGIASPPNPRLPCGLCGIENQGATCYLNSLLQTLLYTPEFREGLFGLSNEELGSLENRERGGKVRIIPLQLQRLFARLLLVDQQAASTTELTDSFGWSNNEELQQHDVQELNRILFSAIDSSLVGTTGKDLITKLYHGSTISEIVCQICGKISEKEEDFLDLNVIVANFSNLQDSLNATFLQKEIMKGKNQYRCSTCCNLVDAKKGLKIRCLPPILTLSLLRFSYDINKGERYKETGKFAFPFEIDMAPYCNKQMKPEDSNYELFSIVIHSGCSYGGHYHAFIRDVDCLGKWLPPDEEPFIAPVTPSKENVDIIQGPTNLIKAILFQQQDHCLPVEALCMEVSKWTGLSWNKKFKSAHGPINKFLQKYNDLFYFNNSTSMVYLKNNISNADPEGSTSSTSDGENVTNSPKESKKNTVINSLKLNFFDKKRAQNPFAPFSDNWFDFNDSRVSPILVKDIEKQFCGKESAYMLFYRRKSLLRPVEARNNPIYSMPEKLHKLADDENSELARQREEYETALNTITLQVHLGNNYICSNGVLEPKSTEIYVIDLEIDKRKFLIDLKDNIAKITSELYPSHEFVLHTAREVPAGLHLYDELTEAHYLETLKDLGILEGTKLFVWDGERIGGEIFSIGIAHEPILLNICVILPTGETSEMSRGFPKTTTIGELKVLISELAFLPLEDIKLCKLDTEGEESRTLSLDEKDDGKTLSERGFLDGDNLVAESITTLEEMELKENSNNINILVQNNCQVFPEDTITDSQYISIAEDFESSVKSLKLLAQSLLNLNSSKSYILRKFLKNQSRKPPLHEHLTLREAGLHEVSCVLIEEGIPPDNDQITVMFNVGIGIGDTPDFEVTIDKKMNVHECLKQMLSLAGLPGDSWHLRKTNWCGEPMEQLCLDGTTLEDEGVQHGDNLLIVEGRLPPKGFLNFTIWLFPAFESLLSPQNTSMNGLFNGIEGLFLNICDSVLPYHKNSGFKIGEVELSSESTVAELKKYVLTLPTLSNVVLPSVRYLRLRLIDGEKPGKILRGLSNSLRKLKILSHQVIGAQILNREEDLTQNDILLNVCQRIPDSKTYTPPLEMIWDTNKSTSPKHLKQVLSDNLSIPVQRLVIAKHFPDRFAWLVIDDGTNQKKNNKKKRWGGGKSNLRHAPYYFKDGDTIGIKDRLSDPEELDDFMTKEDTEGQEILKIAAENKRLKRQEDKSPSRGEWVLGGSDRELPRHAKKSEIGITIHVDDFT